MFRATGWMSFLAFLLAAMVVACGDSNDNGGTTTGSTTTASNGGGGAQEAAIDGPLVFVSGLGMFVVRPDDSGDFIEFADVENASVSTAPALSEDGTAAFVLTFQRIEGESYASMGYLSRLDLVTGQNERFAELGFDRESDDSDELFEHREIAVAGGDVWVIRRLFGDAESGELLRIDGNTGELAGSVPRPRARSLVADGELLYFWSANGFEVLDPATEAVETLIPANTPIGELLDPAVDLAPHFLSRSGAPVDEEFLERALAALAIDASSVGANVASMGPPIRVLAVGDGALWFQWAVSRGTTDGDSVLGEAVLRFDLKRRVIDTAIPTIGFGEHFLEATTISNGGGDITWHNGSVWVSDPQSNGALLRIVPGEAAPALVHEPCSAEQICSGQSDVSFNRTAPGELWIHFARMEDRGGGSRSGEIFMQQVDGETGAVLREVPVRGIAGLP